MHIMIRLVNIKIDDKTASADFYPENSKAASHIVVDLDSGEITQFIESAELGSWGKSHARRELLRMAHEHSSATERTVLWY